MATTAAAAALVRLVERLGAPVITTQKGKGAVPSDHPLHLGNWANEPPVRRLIADCDLLIAVGTRFSYFPTGGWSLRLPDTIVQIDVDPTELGQNYPIEVGIEGDVEVAVEALSGQLDVLGHEPAPWRADEVAAVMAEVAAAIGSRPEIDILMRLREALPPETLVFNDPTTIAFWARSLWKTDRPRTWFIPSGFGTLGFALPAAIGAKLARRDTPTVAIVGDAGFMFTVQDLMTAVEHHVPVIVLVFNDRGYGVERRHQDHLYGRRSGVDLLPPDFVALAHAFGATGIRLDDHTLIGDTVARHLNADGPVLIEVPGALEHPGYGAFGRYGNQA